MGAGNPAAARAGGGGGALRHAAGCAAGKDNRNSHVLERSAAPRPSRESMTGRGQTTRSDTTRYSGREDSPPPAIRFPFRAGPTVPKHHGGPFGIESRTPAHAPRGPGVCRGETLTPRRFNSSRKRKAQTRTPLRRVALGVAMLAGDVWRWKRNRPTGGRFIGRHRQIARRRRQAKRQTRGE